MQRCKRIQRTCAFIAATLICSLSACSAPNIEELIAPTSIEEAKEQEAATNTQVVSSAALLEDGVLSIGLMTESTAAPDVIVSATNELSGVDVELSSVIADELGLKARFVSVADVGAAGRGECDIVMNAKAGEDSSVDIVGRYTEEAIAFFHRGAQTRFSVDDLIGTTVGVQDGSTSQFMLDQSNIAMNQVTFENLNAAFDALAQGEVDFVLCDAYSGAYLAALQTNLSFCGTLNEPTSAGIAVALDNTELQSAISAALTNAQQGGVYDLIRKRWLGGMSPLSAETMISGVELSDALIQNDDSESETIAGSEDEQDGSTAGSNAAGVFG